jgi:protocatechuate 3,4-dioxygenase beta subunit
MRPRKLLHACRQSVGAKPGLDNLQSIAITAKTVRSNRLQAERDMTSTGSVSSVVESVEGITPAVHAAMSATPDARLRAIMESFVSHMHAFARDVQLTEGEFEQGVQFLNRIGQTTSDTHNEGILFSDALGFSTLVCLLNNGKAGATETAAALLGPFWRMHSPVTENGGSIVRSPTPGPALFMTCRVCDPQGRPLSDVTVDVWQASPVGLYENQDETQADMNLRGQFTTASDGSFAFQTVRPAGYPVPTHGPVGDMLRAQKRHPFRPAHLHFLGVKPGFKTLITQVFVGGDQYLESDVVFGVTRHLIADFQPGVGAAPDPAHTGPWWQLTYDFVMEPGESVLPLPPIK